MKDTLLQLAQSIAASPLQDVVVNWLRNVPGLPPVVQAVHILSVACIFASMVFLSLRVVGVAVPSQSPAEMARRLMPWMWSALLLLFLTGMMFVVARPRRYLLNPVFGIKVCLLTFATICSVCLSRFVKAPSPHWLAKPLAAATLIAWLGVILAGRWIAYSDYLFPPD